MGPAVGLGGKPGPLLEGGGKIKLIAIPELIGYLLDRKERRLKKPAGPFVPETFAVFGRGNSEITVKEPHQGMDPAAVTPCQFGDGKAICRIVADLPQNIFKIFGQLLFAGRGFSSGLMISSMLLLLPAPLGNRAFQKTSQKSFPPRSCQRFSQPPLGE